MKKLFFSIALVLALGASLQAQDTVWQKPAPLGNYYNTNWIDTAELYKAANDQPTLSKIIARQFYTPQKGLVIYGIAAMMMNSEFLYFEPSSHYPDLYSFFEYSYPDDPTFDNCEESLVLYQYRETPTPAMVQLGDSLPIHILHTPVSYWIMSDRYPVSYLDTMPKPVFERYFSTPQTVYDTFYVGFTHTSGGFSEKDSIWHEVRPGFDCFCFKPKTHRLTYEENVAAYVQYEMDSPGEWRFLDGVMPCSYFIFPIIAPPDTTLNPSDTTIVPGGDTTGVGICTNDLLYRYTSVQPNPATDKVRVTSSFGLTRIEAYDLRGRLLFETPAGSSLKPPPRASKPTSTSPPGPAAPTSSASPPPPAPPPRNCWYSSP